MSDLTFITNEGDNTLENRLAALLGNAAALDLLAGYIRASGFDMLSRHFPPGAPPRVRALVGIGADPETVRRAAAVRPADGGINFQAMDNVRNRWRAAVAREMAECGDSPETERGARTFMRMLRDGKLEVRAHPSRDLHAKLHIVTFAPGDRDRGRVITGSSNLTAAGLARNLEFNVELKSAADYEFALGQFNRLWNDAVDVSAACLDALQNRSWLRDDIAPRELYLKLLAEYFRADLDADRPDDPLPGGMMQLEYQRQAVRNAERIIASFGGVLLADVVGLGKTYMAAMLAKRLGGKSVIVAPPAVLEADTPGSWPAVFRKFDLPFYERSLGRLDDFPRRELERCENFFIDEAHRFRSGGGVRYEQLARLCRGKRVVLVTATPYNNRPDDLLALLSLFQPRRDSDIPGVRDLEDFFGKHSRRLKKAPPNQRVRVARQVAAVIRHRVSRFVTVRRTRAEIAAHFPRDLRRADLNFPVVEKPAPLFYQMNAVHSAAFDAAVAAAQKLHYARYQPLAYLKDPAARRNAVAAEQNIAGFVKTLLVKRLESSFTAFRATVDRLVESHRHFLRAYERDGHVYFSKRDMKKIMACLEEGDHDELQRLLDAGRGTRLPAADFTAKLGRDLKADLRALEKLQTVWRKVDNDPKLDAFINEMGKNKILRRGKIVVFTESADTAMRVAAALRARREHVLMYHSGVGAAEKRKVTQNFDATNGMAASHYRILVATEALAEGVNLHAAHAVVNYDIPWNPTRLMQRAGRINRVGGTHKRIYIFNFFPTDKGEDALGLTRTAKAKLAAFVALLGSDFRHLTEDEDVDSHRLFELLNSAAAAEGEAADEDDDSELKYLREIEKVRDEAPALYERIKNLPRKARAARSHSHPTHSKDNGGAGTVGEGGTVGGDGAGGTVGTDGTVGEVGTVGEDGMGGVGGVGGVGVGVGGGGALLTYFKYGGLDKFYLTEADGKTRELPFVRAAEKLRAESDAPSRPMPGDYFRLLAANRTAFERDTAEESDGPAPPKSGGARQLSALLSAVLGGVKMGRESREFLTRVAQRLDAGALPPGAVRDALNALRDKTRWNQNAPDTAAALLRGVVPEDILRPYGAEKIRRTNNRRRETILSAALQRSGGN